MKRTLASMTAVAFIAFFITIIVIADRGEGNQWWAFIERIPYGDKVGHVGLIGTLSLLCNLAIQPRQSTRLTRFITLTTLVLLVLLSLEEIAQAFIPARTCDLFDWLADLAGLALGQFSATKLRRWIFR
ncbi:MAG: VanZ family protein [Verrucomicrobia bacterium]|nr:VanZ family protein [Verrucomicrobiota bacterium]